jgi:epoxyqueuosine reductase
MTVITIETNWEDLTRELKQQARELGFSLVGVTPAQTPGRLDNFHRWLESGFAGEMDYIHRRRDAYAHPDSILRGCRCVLMLGTPYLSDNGSREPLENCEGYGKVARYAHSGVDYHDVIRNRLQLLKRWLLERCPGARIRGVVDTAPLLEREFAEAAGLGWVGKNTLLLNKTWGSYFFLAALLTDLPLVTDQAYPTNHCGTCRACLEACPTDAFVGPYVLDARRCLSYVTIEHAGVAETGLSENQDGWLFGCDICQEVCPWNRKSLTTEDPIWSSLEKWSHIELLEVLGVSEEQFQSKYKRTPLARAKRHGLIRNAVLVIGWQRLQAAVEPLERLLGNEEEILRAAAVWALGRIGNKRAVELLQKLLETEQHSLIRSTIRQALKSQTPAVER